MCIKGGLCKSPYLGVILAGLHGKKLKKVHQKINKAPKKTKLIFRNSSPRALFWQSLGRSDFSILYILSQSLQQTVLKICRLSTDCRSIVDILSLKVYLSEEVFVFVFFQYRVGKLTYHKCIIANSNSRRKTGFSLFCVTNTTAFGHFTESNATDEFLLCVIAIQKTRVQLILTWRLLLGRNILCCY